jgi:hypothetical protein
MKSKAKVPRDTVIGAIDILNDLMGEIMNGVDVYKHYVEGHKTGVVTFDDMAGAQRLCFTSIILALNKVREFNRRYLRIVPQGVHRAALTQLQEEIVARGIPEFRNHCIGHIWNPKTKQLVKHSEVMKQLSVIVGGNVMAFVNWLHGTGSGGTVVGILESMRDTLKKEYSVMVSEVINR